MFKRAGWPKRKPWLDSGEKKLSVGVTAITRRVQGGTHGSLWEGEIEWVLHVDWGWRMETGSGGDGGGREYWERQLNSGDIWKKVS